MVKLSVFRPWNLLVLTFVMCVIRFKLLEVLDDNSFTNNINSLKFILYILGSVLIAAAGYLHNNFLDQEVDRLNDKSWKFPFSPKTTNILLLLLNFTGITLLITFSLGTAVLFGAIPILLLFLYNVYLKKIGFIGNLLVAFLTTYQLIGLIICDTPIQSSILWESTIFLYILFLLGASFLIMLSREIVKDIEDVEGDKMMKYKTLPIVIGQKPSKIFSGILILSTFVYFISFVAQNEIGSWISYSISFILLLTLLLSFSILIKSKEKKDFTEISSLLKLAIGLATILLIFIS